MYPNRKTTRTGRLLLDSPEEKTVNKLREAIGLPPLNSSVPIEKKEGEQLKVGIQRFDPSIPVVIDYYTLYPKPDGGWEESPDPYGYDEILLKNWKRFKLSSLPGVLSKQRLIPV